MAATSGLKRGPEAQERSEAEQLLQKATGLVRPAETYLAHHVEKHLANYVADLERRERSENHIGLTTSRIPTVCARCGIKRLADITAAKVAETPRELRRNGLATETTNHYLTSMKMFASWLRRQGRLTEDPLAGLSRQNADMDRRVNRGALTILELGRLIQAAEGSAVVFRGLSGPDRAPLYTLAAFSGLRAGELASITAVDLNLDANPPTVTVRAAYAKNRRDDVLPLSPDVADYLRQRLASRPTRPVGAVRSWPGTWSKKAAAMLPIDLAAGIEADRYGQRIDFHAFRASYATNLARLGVNLQTAQALLRHFDPKLTAKTYTKLGITDLGSVVASLRLPEPGRKPETGNPPH